MPYEVMWPKAVDVLSDATPNIDAVVATIVVAASEANGPVNPRPAMSAAITFRVPSCCIR